MENKLIEIKSWKDGKVLFSAECADIRTCLEIGVKAAVNFSYANLNRASLDGAHLNGVNLNRASLDGANLNGAHLNRASLDGANLNYANLNYANLNYANLNGAHLNRASLDGARLSYASLDGAGLSGARLSGDHLPKIAKVDNLFTKILQAIGHGGKLRMATWHTCETTHCIAGWTVFLAGDAGRVAETLLGTPYAGALIINESCHYLEGKVPDFYSDNETGMAFIKSCAEKEKQLSEGKS